MATPTVAEEDVRLGARVSTTHSPEPSRDLYLEGQFISLTRLTKGDMPSLWKNLELPNNEPLMAYLPLTDPDTKEHLWQELSYYMERGVSVYAIRGDPSRLSPSSSDPNDAARSQQEAQEVLGVIAYIEPQPSHRAIEIGAVIFGPALQRTSAATESMSLLLRHAFGEDVGATPGISPPYRRVVWKCNHLNTNSRRAAERLGFVYEGTLRKHLIVKGRSRDSDWLSMVDEDWPAVKTGLESWFAPSNFDEKGRQIRGLEECRDGAKR